MQHSDLKPDNVMFRGGTGDAVLCDLGVGRISRHGGRGGGGGGGATATSFAGHGGTLLYLAPELLKDETGAATRASDV
jgi:serine/threonine protein kinase